MVEKISLSLHSATDEAREQTYKLVEKFNGEVTQLIFDTVPSEGCDMFVEIEESNRETLIEEHLKQEDARTLAYA